MKKNIFKWKFKWKKAKEVVSKCTKDQYELIKETKYGQSPFYYITINDKFIGGSGTLNYEDALKRYDCVINGGVLEGKEVLKNDLI
jgi:hypothetical protein